METYNVVKSFKVENQLGASDTSKVLLLKSLHIQFKGHEMIAINNIEYGFQIIEWFCNIIFYGKKMMDRILSSYT